ncbi:Gfo/Idh/MocA family protein [Solicola sp. PLA-1-18]|uniref:Gfo/Idh/MocA family protein n=1 Tax=Solicola sp. PLA-1-18 TaxID=3380532 RepID=UPI003B8278EE
MISVAMVGCGNIAQKHATHVGHIEGASMVAVCDREPIMAAQLADRFDVPHRFTDVGQMLDECRPDVVHITTPPASHFPLAVQCLEAGAHVYIEKPFTLTTDEAEVVVALAADKGLTVIPGHNGQFTHAMVRMRDLVRSGYLGGKPVHIESLYCYDMSDPTYAQAMLGDRDHWVRKLPGSLLQNLISHGVARIAEFIESDDPEVTTVGFTSPLVEGLGHGDIIDEVRVIIKDADRSTAVFTFSSQIKPELHQFRLYGPKASLVVDDDYQVLVKVEDKSYRSYLRYLVAPAQFAGQYLANTGWNARHFARRKFHFPYDSGMRTLLEAFYTSIETGSAPPITSGEILRTSRIMDRIFESVRTAP